VPDLILVAEDNPDIRELISYNLEQEGFEVVTVSRGDQVIGEIDKKRPALLLLDLMLPGQNGIEVCKQLRMRDETRSLPIIIVTAKSTETDKIVGLELGADDYITKPFSPKELVARTKALLRRVRQTSEPTTGGSVLKARDLVMNLDGHRVTLRDKELPLTLTEFNILRELLSDPAHVLSRADLLSKAIGADISVTDRTIDVHMASLRKKLGDHGEMIETVRGVGYRFKP
jgi:DNA-binding response OmpR family regulator